jgi:D-serine deaminase-like pyridoxal phosphate-dependent protein
MRGRDLPHQGQKTPEIIQKELAAGAIGVTCAKLGEAEVLAAVGIRDILIANQIVGPAKMRRLVDLVAIADPIIGVDTRHRPHIACRDRGRYRACTVPACSLAHPSSRWHARSPPSHVCAFVGVMGWESHAVTIAEPSEKARVVGAAIPLLMSRPAAPAVTRTGNQTFSPHGGRPRTERWLRRVRLQEAHVFH